MALRILLVAATLLLCGNAWGADQREIDAEAARIADNVMSPFCPARLLRDCPSPQAAELKKQIHEMVAAGRTEDQIFVELIASYGDGVRAVPTSSMAWLMPFVFLIGGLIAAVIWLQIRRRGEGAAADPLVSIDPEIQRQIDEEIGS